MSRAFRITTNIIHHLHEAKLSKDQIKDIGWKLRNDIFEDLDYELGDNEQYHRFSKRVDEWVTIDGS
jgi:hypothetical protein